MKLCMHAMAAAIALIGTSGAWAGEPEAKKWVDSEFQPSSLSKDQQMAEMKWFIDAAAKLKAKGVNEISVVSETITTHEYESKTLAKAFTEITDIRSAHDLIQESDVVELQTSMCSPKSIYDGWISDSDLIGTHYRYGAILPLSDYMAGAGKEWTNPNPGPEGLHRHQLHHRARRQALPAARPAVRQPLLVPRRPLRAQGPQGQVQGQVRLRAGCAAELERLRGHRRVLHQRRQGLDGKKVYGRMDYGKKDPSLGWRFTDAWFSMAGAADKGLPNGMPVDEWGIRVADDKCTPVGASISRGGAATARPRCMR